MCVWKFKLVSCRTGDIELDIKQNRENHRWTICPIRYRTKVNKCNLTRRDEIMLGGIFKFRRLDTWYVNILIFENLISTWKDNFLSDNITTLIHLKYSALSATDASTVRSRTVEIRKCVLVLLAKLKTVSIHLLEFEGQCSNCRGLKCVVLIDEDVTIKYYVLLECILVRYYKKVYVITSDSFLL